MNADLDDVDRLIVDPDDDIDRSGAEQGARNRPEIDLIEADERAVRADKNDRDGLIADGGAERGGCRAKARPRALRRGARARTRG